MERETVLVTLDGSQVAEAALPYARLLAAALGSRLELLCVVEPPDGTLPAEHGYADRELRRTLGEREAYLDALTSRLLDRQEPLGRRVMRGRPVDEIVAAAADADIVAVVMVTHGQGGVRCAIVDSVVDKVLRLTHTPLLLVRPDIAADAVARVQLRRILAPLDGSARAEAALPLATTLARATGATLVLARAEPPLVEHAPEVVCRPNVGEEHGARIAEARLYLDHVRATLSEVVAVEARLVSGAALELPDYARNEGADLVVMTTRGWGKRRRRLFGSVADRMVRLGPPVLLVPQPTPDLAARSVTCAVA